MKASFDPHHLDVAAFAKAGDSLDGSWPLVQLPRLASMSSSEAPALDSDLVTWRVRGELRELRGGIKQVWLHLHAEVDVRLECQRCLHPVGAAVQAERSFLFVADENTAAQLDADSEDDVLVLTRSLDVVELVEDELLLGLPLVPRHDECPEPLPVRSDTPTDEEPPPHPFAALAALKRGNLPN